MYAIRNLTHWNPFGPLERFHAELERGGLSLAGSAAATPVEVWSEGDDLRLRALVPGVRPEDLEITVEGDTVTLRGAPQSIDEPKDGRWLRRERAAGAFVRTLQLPFDVDADRIQATVANGVLVMELPRSAAQKPRRIPVRTA